MLDVVFLKNVRDRIVMLEELQWEHDNKSMGNLFKEVSSNLYIGVYTETKSSGLLSILQTIYTGVHSLKCKDTVKIYLTKWSDYGIADTKKDISKKHEILWRNFLE